MDFISAAQRVVNKGNHVLDGVTLRAQWPDTFRFIEIAGTTLEMTSANLKLLLLSTACDRAKVKEVISVNGKFFAEMESEKGQPDFFEIFTFYFIYLFIYSFFSPKANY